MAPYTQLDWCDDGDIECDKCEQPRYRCNCTGEDEWCKNTDHYYEYRKSECECRPNDKMHLCEEWEKLIERCICEDEYCHDCHMDVSDYEDESYVDPKELNRHSYCCGATYLAQVYPECADDDHQKMIAQIGQKRKLPQPAFTKNQNKIRREYLRKRKVTKVLMVYFYSKFSNFFRSAKKSSKTSIILFH